MSFMYFFDSRPLPRTIEPVSEYTIGADVYRIELCCWIRFDDAYQVTRNGVLVEDRLVIREARRIIERAKEAANDGERWDGLS
jgi:hypothetical protein